MPCCCGLFGKHKKDKKKHHANGGHPEPQAFAVRPVKHTVQPNGQFAYHTGNGGGGMPQTQQYRPSYGMGGGGGAVGGANPELDRNRVYAMGAASVINKATEGKYSKVVDKGAVMAADKYTQYQQKQAMAKQQQ